MAEGTSTDEDQRSAFKRFSDAMTQIFVPILPALIAAGLVQGLVSILTAVGWLDDGSAEYYVLSTIGSAVFFFLPFLLAVSSARVFGANPYVAMGLAAILLHPDTAALTNAPQTVEFVGVPIAQTQYPSSVVPIILVVWVLSLVSRLLTKVLPELLHTLLVPPVATLVTGLAALLLLGPAGNLLALGVGAVVEWAQGVAPWLVPTLIGATGALLISVGASFALFPIAIAQVAELGYNTVYGPGMLAVNSALVGAALAVTQGTRSRRYRTYTGSAALTTAMGVSQPTLYGIAIPLVKPLVATCIGGAAGGLVAGLTGFRVYALVPSGAAAIPAFFGPEGGLANPLKGAAVMVTALGVGYVATRLLGFDDPSADVVDEITGGEGSAGAGTDEVAEDGDRKQRDAEHAGDGGTTEARGRSRSVGSTRARTDG